MNNIDLLEARFAFTFLQAFVKMTYKELIDC